MGNTCHSNAVLCSGEGKFNSSKVNMVTSLGINEEGMACKPLGIDDDGPRTRGFSFGSTGHDVRHRKYEVRCPEGHVMRAHVSKELFMRCKGATFCDGCEREIEREGASYQCVKCPDSYTICVDCAREALGIRQSEDRGVPVIDILPGDIFLCGPDKAGIHHVVLSRGRLEPAAPEYRNLIDLEPGMELYSCETIESTQTSIGDTTWWYPTTTVFQRDPYTGDVKLVADHPPDSDVVSAVINPVPMKILLHPLRDVDSEDGLDLDAFEEVIKEASEASKRYSKWTAVNSFLESFVDKGTISLRENASEEEQEELLDKIRRSWDSRPICASVAIKCWQRYFDFTCDGTEETVRQIVEVMPHWCNKSTPSLMVKILTQHGWALLDNFDGLVDG